MKIKAVAKKEGKPVLTIRLGKESQKSQGQFVAKF